MATATGTYVRVSIDAIASGYDYVRFRWSFWTSSGSVWNGDGNVIRVTQGGETIYETTQTGQLYEISGEFNLSYGYPSQGNYHRFVPQIQTYDNGGDGRYGATATDGGNTWTMSRISSSNFSQSATGLTETQRRINFSGVGPLHGEVVGYSNVTNTAWPYAVMESQTSGYFIQTNMAINTKYPSQNVYLVQKGTGILDTLVVKVPQWAGYKSPTKGWMSASYDLTVLGKIVVNWGAWTGFGNLPVWSSYIDLINVNTGVVLKSYSVVVTSAGSYTILDAPVGVNVKLRIRSTGLDHDSTTRTEYSNEALLGFQSNFYVKVNGIWKPGIKAFTKVNGVWRANTGPIKLKKGAVWK
jgi:hypothetical protein